MDHHATRKLTTPSKNAPIAIAVLVVLMIAALVVLMIATPILIAVAAVWMANHLNETVLAHHPTMVSAVMALFGGIWLVVGQAQRGA